MYTPKFSLSFTLLFSFLFIILQSLADISTMLIYARDSTRYTYTFFSYATCEWPEIFIQNKVLFCTKLLRQNSGKQEKEIKGDDLNKRRNFIKWLL